MKLLKEGHSLSLGVRNKESLINTPLDPKSNNPRKFLVHSYDALDESSSNNWVESTVKTFKNIDTVIHCAGIFKRTNLIYNDNELKEIEDLWLGDEPFFPDSNDTTADEMYQIWLGVLGKSRR